MRKWMIRGVALVFVGLLLCGVGLAISGGNWQVLGGEGAYEKREVTYAPEGLSSVKILEKSADVNIGVSPDEDIHITYYENRRNNYQITKGKSWEIVKTTSRNWTDQVMNFNFTMGGHALTVLLPTGTKWDLELDNDLGDVAVTGGDYGGLYLDTDYGGLELTDLTAETLGVATAKGDLRLKQIIVAGKLEAVSEFGGLQFNQVEVAGVLEGTTANGDITLEKVKAHSIDIDSDYGQMSLQDTAAENQIQVETDKGDIDLERVSAGTALSLETDYGEIAGSIVGKMSDYSIESGTDFGENNLPPVFQEGGIQLHAFTDLGDIHITFQERGERR